MSTKEFTEMIRRHNEPGGCALRHMCTERIAALEAERDSVFSAKLRAEEAFAKQRRLRIEWEGNAEAYKLQAAEFRARAEKSEARTEDYTRRLQAEKEHTGYLETRIVELEKSYADAYARAEARAENLQQANRGLAKMLLQQVRARAKVG